MRGQPANNVLLTGARGTGKSSLIKACLNEFAPRGLRLIEVDKTRPGGPARHRRPGRRAARAIHRLLRRPVSFDEGEPGYKALKSILDGSIASRSDNVLIYATSNRRHLLPEYMKENLSYQHTEDGEVHPGEVVEEKISLSRALRPVGQLLSVQPGRIPDDRRAVAGSASAFGAAAIAARARRRCVWALERGSRSGRVAFQFARDYAGRHAEKARAQR